MSSVITPTVGRKVWYRPSEADLAGNKGMQQYSGQPLDATVIAVWNDRMVNLKITDNAGRDYVRTSVPLRQDGDPVPGQTDGKGNFHAYMHCEWMPYQKGQAAKAEAAEAANKTAA